MAQRIVSIWFPNLLTDWILRRQPTLQNIPFALVMAERGKRMVKAVNSVAAQKGVHVNMVLADCKALVPDLHTFDYLPEQPVKILNALAEWCLRYTPMVSVHSHDGLILDTAGCTHLWGGEREYLHDIHKRMEGFGYTIQTAMADTLGAAWAVCRFGSKTNLIAPGRQAEAIRNLPPASLRLEPQITERLEKLGLNTVQRFITMPRPALRRRFGKSLLTRLDQALGGEMELVDPIRPISPYQENLPTLEPIKTAAGIEVALKNLLETLCQRLSGENKGLRKCELICYRMDGNVQKIEISTNRPSRNTKHLFKLFEIKIRNIEPDLGIELFTLEAPVVEELLPAQDALWSISDSNEATIAELVDRISGKTGGHAIHRYLPTEHYWPERSVKTSTSLSEKPDTAWQSHIPRPLHLLAKPEPITVMVPIPDYPPITFWYKGIQHTVKKADGPERIEQEWWIQDGLYRDYYCVEDEKGFRYWLFRLGDYYAGDPKWFLHGFFA